MSVTNQTALGYMKNIMNDFNRIKPAQEAVEVADLCIIALEKQIPMKVIGHEYCIPKYGEGGCQVGGIFCYKATCPTCNNTIVDGVFDSDYFVDIKFCDQCGQMLDWEQDVK